MKSKTFATLLAVITFSTMALAQEKMPLNKNESSPVKTEQQQDSVYYACKMHPGTTMDSPGKCKQCKMPLEKKVTTRTNIKSPKMEGVKTYICQAHSEIKLDKPGKCSECGMDLVIEEKIK